ncbi:MAG TPA: alpha/beta fold hydrolase [Burkholderiales bacterium]
MADRVVLVHGLWLNGPSMAPLGWRLARDGYAVSRFSYWSVLRGLDNNVDRLIQFCRKFESDRLHLVGHSLGGVLILAAIARGLKVHRAVLMGIPYKGSISAHGLARVAIGKRMLGRTLSDWLRREKPALECEAEIGVLSGDRSIGIGKLISPLPLPNDGVVCLDETKVPGATDSIVLPVFHTAMPFSPLSARAVATFLKKGRFQ